MINYSIIIPHKDIPSLLERCVLSIPQRDDVQIIIVDDNSDEYSVGKLQALERSCQQKSLSIIYLDDSQAKGAGHARNIGLSHAVGKWIVFADADDTFEIDSLNAAFDEYLESDKDIVFFSINCLDAETLEKNNNANQAYLAHLFAKVDAENRCRYKIKVPWGKFIKRKLIEYNAIRFEEVQVGNDAWFSLQIGYRAEKIAIDYTPVYNWMVRSGSITSNKGKEAVLTHLVLQSRLNSFKESHKLSKYRSNIFVFIPMLLRAHVPMYKAVLSCAKNTSSRYILNDIVNVVKMLLLKCCC